MVETGWTSGSHLSQPPSQAWPAIASFPGLCSDMFWMPPMTETPQPPLGSLCQCLGAFTVNSDFWLLDGKLSDLRWMFCPKLSFCTKHDSAGSLSWLPYTALIMICKLSYPFWSKDCPFSLGLKYIYAVFFKNVRTPGRK